MNITMTVREAMRLYRYGNNHGCGYPPYTDDAGDDTIEAAVAAAERDGWETIHERRSSEEIAVLRNADGEWLGIGGDAMGHGAWAVVLSDLIDA